MSKSILSFRSAEIPPPTIVYIPPGAGGLLTVRSAFNSITIVINLRFLLPNGQVQPVSYELPSTTTYNEQTLRFPLSEGFLLSARITATGGNVTAGSTFVTFAITQSPNASAVTLQTVIAGFLTSAAPASYPGSTIFTPAEGPTFTLSQALSNPAAGAEFTGNLDLNLRGYIATFMAVFTASAAAATRTLQLTLNNTAGEFWRSRVGITATANQVTRVVGAVTGTETYTAGSYASILLPAGPFEPSLSISTLTTNIQAGDQWSSPVVSFISNIQY